MNEFDQSEEASGLNEVLHFIQQLVDGMDDSPEKRKARRALKGITGGHHSSEWLTQILERKSDNPAPIFLEARRIVESNLQLALDCLFDVSTETQSGTVSFARFTLLYFCVDELLAALHLTQHAFVNQAYVHLRSVLEALEKAELFGIQPDLVNLWASTDPSDKKNQLRELSPASVREKLGKDRYDPIYGFFSDFGPHSSFRMAQTRSGFDLKHEERRKLRLWIGGCPFESNVVFSALFLVWVSTKFANKVAEFYIDRLNVQEMKIRLQNALTDSNEFLKLHLIPWAEREGFDTKPIIESIENAPSLKDD